MKTEKEEARQKAKQVRQLHDWSNDVTSCQSGLHPTLPDTVLLSRDDLHTAAEWPRQVPQTC